MDMAHKKDIADSAAVMRVCEEIVDNAQRAYSLGLQSGNGGNISGRVPDTDLVVIKSSGCSFEACSIDNLVIVNLDSEQLAGQGKPSRELQSHLAIYRHRTDVNGVFHCHSPWAIACAEIVSALPTVTYHAATKLGVVPVLSLETETSQATIDAIVRLLTENPGLRAFIQAKHGVFSLHETITLARYNAELVEETAQIAWLISARLHTKRQ